MALVKLLLIATLVSVLAGQVVRIPLSETTNITLTDLFVAATLLVFFVYSLLIRRKLILNPRIVTLQLIFSLIAISSSIIAVNKFGFYQVFISSLFLVRLIIYFGFSFVVANVVERKKTVNFLNIFLIVSAIFILFGFTQLLILPDFRVLAPFGWDPHQKRIASTFLDPNFAGGFIVIAFIASLVLYLSKKNHLYLLIASISFLTILLTFSRSSYLALIVGITSIGFLKSKKILISFAILFTLSFILIGQIRTRIIGAFTLDDTSQARIESWQNGLTIFKSSPILGVGFNTYRLSQKQYGFFSQDEPFGGHSGSSPDSSFLLVAATTGIIGLSFFSVLILFVMKKFINIYNKSDVGLIGISTVLSLIIHSQFVNSFFFPQIMLIFWFFVGLALVYDN